MNKFLKITTVFLAIFIALSSCNKDEPIINDIDKPIINDNYYVKYVIKCSQSRYYVSKFSVNTDKGIVYFSDYKSTYWTQTYGPVKKGFTATATAESVYPTIEIYASINQEPFALKTTNTRNTQVTASYTIDF